MKWPFDTPIEPAEEGVAELILMACQKCGGDCGDLTLVVRHAHVEQIDGTEELVSTVQVMPAAAAAIAEATLRFLPPFQRRRVMMDVISDDLKAAGLSGDVKAAGV